jgi:hypothetical protein
MSIESQLQQQATEEAERRSSRVSALELADIERGIAAGREARERLKEYRPRIGNDYICYYCMLESRLVSKLYPLGGGTDTEEYLKCPECKAEIIISV